MKKLIITGVSIVLLITGVLVVHRELTSDTFGTTVIGAEMNDAYTVVIDPGHGGYDSGTIAVDQTEEKEITLEIAKMVGDILNEKGYRVIYTRDSDTVDFADNDNKKDLSYRTAVANNIHADLFLSIHCNASEYKDSYGFETWTNMNNRQSLAFSNNIQSNLKQLEYTQDRGIKDGKSALHVIRESLVPTALVEIGFIDYEDDYRFISTKQGKQNIAEALANAVITTRENK